MKWIIANKLMRISSILCRLSFVHYSKEPMQRIKKTLYMDHVSKHSCN